MVTAIITSHFPSHQHFGGSLLPHLFTPHPLTLTSLSRTLTHTHTHTLTHTHTHYPFALDTCKDVSVSLQKHTVTLLSLRPSQTISIPQQRSLQIRHVAGQDTHQNGCDHTKPLSRINVPLQPENMAEWHTFSSLVCSSRVLNYGATRPLATYIGPHTAQWWIHHHARHSLIGLLK